MNGMDHLYGVSLASRWWPNIKCWLNSFVPDQFCKKILYFCDFSGGGSGLPAPPPLWIRLCLFKPLPIHIFSYANMSVQILNSKKNAHKKKQEFERITNINMNKYSGKIDPSEIEKTPWAGPEGGVRPPPPPPEKSQTIRVSKQYWSGSSEKITLNVVSLSARQRSVI